MKTINGSYLGEMRKGRDIGYISSARYTNYIWAACVNCGKERWIPYDNKNKRPQNKMCRHCNGSLLQLGLIGERSVGWEGGRFIDKHGYVFVFLYPDDFFYPMAKDNGYVMEHRLVMAKKLGRCLQPWEIVHHKGIRYSDIRNKADNLDDNLELATRGSHTIAHNKGYRDGYAKGLIDGREIQIQELKTEIRLLRLQVSEKMPKELPF